MDIRAVDLAWNACGDNSCAIIEMGKGDWDRYLRRLRWHLGRGAKTRNSCAISRILRKQSRVYKNALKSP